MNGNYSNWETFSVVNNFGDNYTLFLMWCEVNGDTEEYIQALKEYIVGVTEVENANPIVSEIINEFRNVVNYRELAAAFAPEDIIVSTTDNEYLPLGDLLPEFCVKYTIERVDDNIIINSSYASYGNDDRPGGVMYFTITLDVNEANVWYKTFTIDYRSELLPTVNEELLIVYLDEVISDSFRSVWKVIG